MLDNEVLRWEECVALDAFLYLPSPVLLWYNVPIGEEAGYSALVGGGINRGQDILRPLVVVKDQESEANVIADKIHAAFDVASQRHTRPRQLIEERLIEHAASGADFTVDDLWQELRESEPRLGRATVYRSVEMLVNMGLLDRIEFANGTHHYRVCGGTHHHHLTCTQCHRVVEVDVCLPVEQIKAIGSQTHFEIEGHSLSLFGRCESCRSAHPA